MKKIIYTLILILVASIAFAADVIPPGVDNIGNPYPEYQQSKPFTVVDDHVCSASADYSHSMEFKAGSKLKWDNIDGGAPGGVGKEHPGVVVQMFKSNSNGLEYKVGDIELSAGETKYITAPVDGWYFFQAFYCDEEQVKCQEVQPYYTEGCDYEKCSEGEVLRKRILKSVVTGGCNGWETTACIDDELTPFVCDGDADQVVSATGGDTGTSSDSGSSDSGSSTTSKTLNVEFQNIAVVPVVAPGEKAKITGRVVLLEDGEYYIEAGFNDETFAFMSSSESKCDGDVHWAGITVNGKKDDKIDFELTPTTYEKNGNYQLVYGAYSGCLADGGEKIHTSTAKVVVGEVNSDSIKTALLGGFTFSGILIFVLIIAIIIVSYLVWFK